MARKKGEETIEAEVVWEPSKTHKVQIRLDTMGPAKKDGRRGQIVIEDDTAPDAVVRWLQSPKCKKATRDTRAGRKEALIWIDDALWCGVSEASPDADSESSTALAHVGPALAETEAARQYLTFLQSEIETAQKDVIETKKACQAEIAQELAKRDREVKICTDQIEAARARLKLELEREDQELRAIQDRRTAANNDRTAQAVALAGDVETYSKARQILAGKLFAQERSWFDAALQATQTPAGALVAAGLLQKIGVPVPAELLQSMAQAANGEQPAGQGGQTPSE